MWTICYKGAFIHGYFDKPQCRWNTGRGYISPDLNSLHAAKCDITRHQKKSNAV